MTEENKKYLKFGKYTADCPEELLYKIKAMHLEQINQEAVYKIFKLIRQEFDPKLHRVNIANDFKKSRFISAKEVLNKRQYACGSLATVVATIFRTLGLPTKLINGKFIKNNPNMKHAWNEIYLIDQNKFIPFDITKLKFEITEYHIREGEYVDWEELER